MSFSRVNKSVGSGSGGGGASLTDAQTAALGSVSLGDITDFTLSPKNFFTLPIPVVQSEGAYVCTTYDETVSGLQITSSHTETQVSGTNMAKAPGFYRMLHGNDFDVAVDLDNFLNQPASAGNEWQCHFLVAIGSTHISGTMLGLRLKAKQDGAGLLWQVARVVSPSGYQGWTSGYHDEYDLESAPTSIRLRIQHSSSEAGFKTYYSLDSGQTYTTVDGTNRNDDGTPTGGTGWFTKWHTKTGNPQNYGNQFSVGGAMYSLLTVGQNVSKTAAQSAQGSVRVKYRDLNA